MSEHSKQRAPVFWFTGLSGAGKSSIAEHAKAALADQGLAVSIIDGDDVRRTLHVHLGFSRADIITNNRLISEICAKSRHDCEAVFVPIISPYRESRRAARQLLNPGFFEIFIDADLDTVIQRDTKGLYRRARDNQIDNMIGFHDSSPYEYPEAPDLRIPTSALRESESANMFLSFVLDAVLSQKPEMAHPQTQSERNGTQQT